MQIKKKKTQKTKAFSPVVLIYRCNIQTPVFLIYRCNIQTPVSMAWRCNIQTPVFLACRCNIQNTEDTQPKSAKQRNTQMKNLQRCYGKRKQTKIKDTHM